MRLIVGLGNPGEEYSRTRHNIGRRVMEFLAAGEKAKFALKKARQAAELQVSWDGASVQLAYPLTYMNLSGEAVAGLVKYWKISAEKDLLVVVDDVALPFGKLRLRGEGSSGGHNGLASIEDHLKSRKYARLRIGIGRAGDFAAEEPLREYVLSVFNAKEEKQMGGLLGKAVEACRDWAVKPLAEAMNRVNAPV